MKLYLTGIGVFIGTWLAGDALMAIMTERIFLSSFPRLSVGVFPFFAGYVGATAFVWWMEASEERIQDG